MSFKVLCINNNFFPSDEKTAAYKEKSRYRCPEYLGEYTVVKEETENGEADYELAEFPPCAEGAFFWDVDAFVCLDGPDETELHLRHIEKLTTEYMAEYGEPPIVKLDPLAFSRIWEGISKELDKNDRA